MSLLKISSPSLLVKLSKLYEGPEIEDIVLLYEQLAPQNVWDVGINRVSSRFNPLPARLCEIMLNCFPCPTLTQLKAVMLISSSRHDYLPQLGDQESFSMAKKTFDFLNNHIEIEELDRQHLEIALSVVLDRLRHLHMQELSVAEKRAICRDVAERILSPNCKEWKITPLIKRYLERNLKSSIE
jgi:hypothetical protein